jgi:hypothetical protein
MMHGQKSIKSYWQALLNRGREKALNVWWKMKWQNMKQKEYVRNCCNETQRS